MANKIVLSDADVLSGHNFKWFIRDHPGNQFLNQLVELHCEEYVNTPTQFRYQTTNKVVQHILDKGGRFLKIVNECDQLEVQDERAIAGKVTKLLRRRGLEIQELRQHQDEKDMILFDNDIGDYDRNDNNHQRKRPREGSYFSQERSLQAFSTTTATTTAVDRFGLTLSPSNSSRMRINHLITDMSRDAAKKRTNTFSHVRKHHRHHHSYNNDSDIHLYDSDNGSLDDGDQSIWQCFERNSERVENDTEWKEHYRRLQEFYAEHGHSGISTDWDGDPPLAEWATRQRQLFREIQSGYRIPTLREENRWKQLQMVNFPLNYEKWHWERKYRQLREILKGEKYVETNVKLPENLQVWLDHQRKLMNDDAGIVMCSKRMEHDQRERLKCLGVY
jgi:hypothetical protein